MADIAPYIRSIKGAERSFKEMEKIAERHGYKPPVEYDREKDFAIQIVESNPNLQRQELAMSLRAAVQNVALCGITLNPAMKLAYLVPRDGRVCLDISYMGLIKVATDSGSVKSVQAHLVYSEDEFAIELGSNKHITHRPKPFGDRGSIVGVYVIAVLADGEELFETMSYEECIAIRDRSKAWQAYTAGKIRSCPWATDEGEMIRKTCVKRASKYWPKTEMLSTAVSVLNEHEGYVDAESVSHGAPVQVKGDTIEAQAVDDITAKRKRVWAIAQAEAKKAGMKPADFIGKEYGFETIKDLPEDECDKFLDAHKEDSNGNA